METVKNMKHQRSQLTTAEVFIMLLVGVAVMGGIWLFTGLLIGLFVL